MSIPPVEPDEQKWTPERIRALREQLGLTIPQAAEKLGVTARTWLSWELPSQRRQPAKSCRILLRMLDSGKL